MSDQEWFLRAFLKFHVSAFWLDDVVTLFSTDDVMNQDTAQLIQIKSQMGNIPKETDFTDKLLEVYKDEIK